MIPNSLATRLGLEDLHPAEKRALCSFEPIMTAISGGIGDALSSAGVGADTAATIGTVAAPALVGAGTGALAGALGGNAGMGALTGGALGALYGGYNAYMAPTPVPGGVALDTSGNPVVGDTVAANGTPLAKPLAYGSGTATSSL